MKEDNDGNLWVRQSWLDTAQRCPEDARRSLRYPENNVCTDEAFIGTASHHTIEQIILGNVEPVAEEIRRSIVGYYRDDPRVELPTMRFTKRSSLEECIELSIRLTQAWVRDIRPVAPLAGARTEVPFAVPLFEHRGRVIGIEGTVDLVPAEGNVLWDWKTSGKDYKQKDKQKWAIQPTIYSTAAVMGGMGRTDFTWPIEFTYGVMIKLQGKCRGQVVTVQRTAQHAAFAEARMRTWVDMYLDIGLDRPWPAIDDSNWLCSATWCDHYADCRGAHITLDHDLFGWVPTSKPTKRQRRAA